jgi:hypothetical protein
MVLIRQNVDCTFTTNLPTTTDALPCMQGSLNVDLNDITMNMVPFPRLHFLLSSMSPLAAPKDLAKISAPRTIDQVTR